MLLITFSHHINGRSTIQENNGHMKFHPELKAEKAVDAFDMFSENLSHPDKGIRVSTLRILCHYEPLNGESNVQPVEKKMQTEVSPTSYAEIQRNNVCSSIPISAIIILEYLGHKSKYFLLCKNNLHILYVVNMSSNRQKYSLCYFAPSVLM